MSSDNETFDDGLDEDDLNHFIGELQRIIHEAPSELGKGMQGRFARTISYLQNKKMSIKEKKTAPIVKKEDKKQLLAELLEILDTFKTRANSPEKFKRIMQITRLREEISQEQQIERSHELKKISEKKI